jgi:hypothetical protein
MVPFGNSFNNHMFFNENRILLPVKFHRISYFLTFENFWIYSEYDIGNP